MGMFKDIFKGMVGQKDSSSGAPASPDMNFNEDYSEFVNKEYTKRQAERKSFEIQWRLNGEFLDGNQYLDINPHTLNIEEVPKLYWYQEREVFNQIATIVETRMSKMSSQKPMIKTRPASSDDIDISAAKITSMLCASTWNDQNMDEQYEDFVSWLELTGTCFWKTIWNPKKGRIIYAGNAGQMQQNPMLQHDPFPDPQMNELDALDQGIIPQPESNEQPYDQEIREGDIETILVPPHEIYPDSSHRRGMKDCRSIIHAKAFHIDEIEDMWGIRVNPESVDLMSLQKMATGSTGIGYASGGMRTGVRNVTDHAVVKEYYERPSRRYPKGRFIVVAGDKTLHAGPLPYAIGDDQKEDFPFIRCVSIDRPGCFWGKSVLERCIPVQRRYNALRNRKAEYLNLVAIGQWTAEEGSIPEGVEINSEPGNIIYHRKTTNPPRPVVFNDLPMSFEKEEATLLAEFTSISGVSELSRYAQAPDGVKSGVALGIAKEQDDTRLATTVARVANSIVNLGTFWIRIYRQFVQEPRLLRYIGGNREADVREWEVSDLRSDDVFIENMAALSETPAQRRQMVFDLLSAGLFTRPEMSSLTEEGRQKVFQLLEFGHWETGYEDDNFLHKSRARRENRQIMDGQPVQVMDFDDHMLHIEAHNRMRMQSEWEEMLRTPIGPVINELMMAHIAEHIQRALAAIPKEPAPPPGQTGQPAKPEKDKPAAAAQ